MRTEAEDYIDQKLAAFEILLNKTLTVVGKGRQQLQGERQLGAVPQDADGQVVAPPFDAAAQFTEPAV